MGSWDKEITEFLALLPSSFSAIPPVFPPTPRLPIPINSLPYAALLLLRTARSEVAVPALPTPAAYFYLQRSSLPGRQAATAPAVTSAAPPPSAQQRPPAQVSPAVSPGVFSRRDPPPQDFLQSLRQSFVPTEEKGRKKKERE